MIFGGRLGEYRYYDMDQALLSALNRCEAEFGEKICKGGSDCGALSQRIAFFKTGSASSITPLPISAVISCGQENIAPNVASCFSGSVSTRQSSCTTSRYRTADLHLQIH